MKIATNIYTLEYPQVKKLIVCGDIHGEFNELVFKLCVQYKMHDTLLIVAGDCGFGFNNYGFYENMVKHNSKRMSQNNNIIVFIRGNHDNPAYFNGIIFNHKNFIAIPDYTIIKACSHTILCIGGAISTDREYRITALLQEQIKSSPNNNSVKNQLSRNYYWKDEYPIYDQVMLNSIKDSYSVDIVITHTAPSFCKPNYKDILNSFANYDEILQCDIIKERTTLDDLYKRLKIDSHPINNWYYGHFHQSNCAKIDNVIFHMLDIMEFCDVN